MRSLHFALIILIGATVTAAADIGENEQQIEARYGKPAKIMSERGNFRVLGYLSGGFMILVDFVNGTSQREGFASPDTSALSKDDVDRILAMTAPSGLKWEELPEKDGARYWNRSDWKAIATVSPDGRYFSVRDPNYVQPKK